MHVRQSLFLNYYIYIYIQINIYIYIYIYIYILYIYMYDICFSSLALKNGHSSWKEISFILEQGITELTKVQFIFTRSVHYNESFL